MTKEIISCGNPDFKMVQFDWFFVDWCNYECSYCSAAIKMSDSFSKETSHSKYKMVLAKLKMIKVPFKIELLGGEPTLHPNLHEVLETLCLLDSCREVELITNLSRSIAFFEQFNQPKYNKTRVLASYHPEYYSAEFLSKSIAISKMEHLEFMVNINLTDEPTDWPSIIELITALSNNDVKFGFNFLNSTPARQINYTPEFFAMFAPYLENRQNNNFEYCFSDGTIEILSESDIVEREYRRFKGYKCTPLMYNIEVDSSIINFCTKRVVPITMKTDDLIKRETCITDCCTCDVMYNYHKER